MYTVWLAQQSGEEERDHSRLAAPSRDQSIPTAERKRRLFRRLALVPVILGGLTLTLTLVYSVVTPPSTPMLARWLTGAPVKRDVRPLEDISPNLVRAVFAAEDQRFCLHHGIDWNALTEVVEDDRGPSRGASTITMQTAKNVFLWPGRSYIRKAIELPLSAFVDLVWGKRRTMEIYLNVAEWGEGVYGAEAAARHWFNKSARDLTVRESNLLAATLPNPIERDPTRPTHEMLAKAGRIKASFAWLDDFMGCLPRK